MERVHVIKSLTKIGVMVKYGVCACDCPEDVWELPFVIQMDNLNPQTCINTMKIKASLMHES